MPDTKAEQIKKEMTIKRIDETLRHIAMIKEENTKVYRAVEKAVDGGSIETIAAVLGDVAKLKAHALQWVLAPTAKKKIASSYDKILAFKGNELGLGDSLFGDQFVWAGKILTTIETDLKAKRAQLTMYKPKVAGIGAGILALVGIGTVIAIMASRKG